MCDASSFCEVKKISSDNISGILEAGWFGTRNSCTYYQQFTKLCLLLPGVFSSVLGRFWVFFPSFCCSSRGREVMSLGITENEADVS